MYSKRIKIFVIISVCLFLVCIARLIQMQVWSDSYYREKIAELKLQASRTEPLKTIRGRILDRNGKVLARDKPQFQLYINYALGSIADERVRRAIILRASGINDSGLSIAQAREQIQCKLEELQLIINKCVRFGGEQEAIENKIRYINNRIWNLRSFLAWRRNSPDPEILKEYGNVNSIPLSAAMADFEKQFDNEDTRIALTAKVTDIADIKKSRPLLKLNTDDDIFAAQVEFLAVEAVTLKPDIIRYYPYGTVAAQTIGWVGPAREDDRYLFEDRLTRYISGDMSGKEDGVEFVCETALRGKRGEIVYDIDRKLAKRVEIEPGNDVSLTLDIELQKRIEEYLSNCELNHNCQVPMGAVVIDVEKGEILSLVSLPGFDLNHVRYNYGDLASDKNEPLRNRALNKVYPPGSVVKPLVLVAGMESGKVNADDVISCPAKAAGSGWPNCWYYNRFKMGHDSRWENTGRNAIRGSCNIYFSRLADKIDPLVLQQWLFKFGYGRKTKLTPRAVQQAGINRDFRQAQGQISNVRPTGIITSFDKVPLLTRSERRWFGMGQGNLRTTVLQVANAMVTLARGGVYKKVKLFVEEDLETKADSTNPGISSKTLATVLDGMHAVVSEPGGTAYKQFAYSGFEEQGIAVYGKTGSTEAIETAWFAGFARDMVGKAIAVAIVVEGGQHGSSDAAPLARNIIQFCLEAGYIGQAM